MMDSEGVAVNIVVLDLNSKEKAMRRVDKLRKCMERWRGGTELVCDGKARTSGGVELRSIGKGKT